MRTKGEHLELPELFGARSGCEMSSELTSASAVHHRAWAVLVRQDELSQ